MEEVFASAYCTIAATSATGPGKGFLGPQLSKQAVTLLDNENNDLQVYISVLNEDFNHRPHGCFKVVYKFRGLIVYSRHHKPSSIARGA
jgi:hypothetical protein